MDAEETFRNIARIFDHDPAKINGFLDTYDEQAQGHLSELEAAVSTRDVDAARDVIHRWKSSSAMIGAPEVSEATVALREALVSSRFDVAVTRLAVLREQHNASIVRLRSWIPTVCG